MQEWDVVKMDIEWECEIINESTYNNLLAHRSKQVVSANKDIEEIISNKLLNKLGYQHNVEIYHVTMDMSKYWCLDGNTIALMKINNSVNCCANVEYWIDEGYL